MNNLGENIKMLCAERELTFVEIERACDLGNGTIRKWVNGTTPNVGSLSAVADYFHVSVDWLLGKTENRMMFEEWNKKYNVEKLRSEAKIFDMLGKIKTVFFKC